MPAGRPTLYKEEYNEQADKLCKLGATDADLADFFNVNEDTINEWKKVHPKFSESLKAGKMLADANVAQRLYERAMGFEHDSEEIKIISVGGQDGGSEIVRVPIRKIYPPDSTAAIFWLKNRRPQEWRDKQEIDQKTEHSGTIEHTIDYTKLSDAALREIEAQIKPTEGKD